MVSQAHGSRFLLPLHGLSDYPHQFDLLKGAMTVGGLLPPARLVQYGPALQPSQRLEYTNQDSPWCPNSWMDIGWHLWWLPKELCRKTSTTGGISDWPRGFPPFRLCPRYIEIPFLVTLISDITFPLNSSSARSPRVVAVGPVYVA